MANGLQAFQYVMWAKASIWESILSNFAEDADVEVVMLDGSYIRAHQHSAGAKGGAKPIGRSRGGLTTKIHAVVDALGNPVRLLLTGGQTHDSVPTRKLLSGIIAEYVLADKAYDTDSLLVAVENRGIKAVIPPRRNRRVQREYDKHLYKVTSLNASSVNSKNFDEWHRVMKNWAQHFWLWSQSQHV